MITGLSGSGKSSLAFDTLYAEGQRRYVESLSAYARQFLQLMEKPDVDLIEGLSPAISIEQRSASHNPRSTVGTVTEIHDYLRLMYARVGTPFCPVHKLPLQSQSVSQMVDATLRLPLDTRVMVLAPMLRERKGEFSEFFDDMQTQGFVRFRIDGAIVEVDALPPLRKTDKHSIDVVVDRLKVRADAKQRLAESFETSLRLGDGRALLLDLDDGREILFREPVCLPGMRLLVSRARAKIVFLQQSDGRLRSVRWPRTGGLLRREPRRCASGAVARQRGDQGLGCTQSVLLSDAGDARTALRVRRGDPHFLNCRSLRKTLCCTAQVKPSSPLRTRTSADGRFCGGTRSKASFRTRNGAFAKPTRRLYARTRKAARASAVSGVRRYPLASRSAQVFIGEGADRRAIYQIAAAPLREAFEYFERLEFSGRKRDREQDRQGNRFASALSGERRA